MSIPATHAYFLQDLVLFHYDPTLVRAEEVRRKWKHISRVRHQGKEKLLQELQKQAEFLGHRIDVADIMEVVAHAQA